MKKIFILISFLFTVLYSDTCIGNNYEPNKIINGKTRPQVTIVAPVSLPKSGVVDLHANATMDVDASPYYQWCTNIGTLKKDSNDYKKIKWILPSGWEDKVYRAKIYVVAGDMFGYEAYDDKSFKGTVNLDPNTPSTQLSIQYIKETDKFKINWKSKNADNLRVKYSWDNVTFETFATLSLKNNLEGSYANSIVGSKTHNRIYIKPFTYKGTKAYEGAVQVYAYSPQTPNTGGKDVETPAQVVMKTMNSKTRATDIYVGWRMVKDSHGKDNAVSYEFSYADNSSFANATTQNVGHVLSYHVSNLTEDKRYYFRVRAINNKDTGKWSNAEYTTIDPENLPTFETTTQTPSNSSTGVSKNPILRWEASDKDGDSLEYYVRIGTDPKNLNYGSGWIEKQYFDWADKYSKALKPNTTYYWQVTYREGHRTPEYYGGEYPKSPLWSFTTEGTGPDLAITNVRMLGVVKIDEWVSFEVTIKNNGSEVADDNDIKPYFIKNGTENEFASYKRGRMTKELNPGEEEKVIVKVQFSNKIEERTFSHYDYNSGGYVDVTETYDNILTDGTNLVRFTLDYNQFDVDTNSANDKKDFNVNYSLADNLPTIELFQFTSTWLKNESKTFIGQGMDFKIYASDNLNIEKIVLEYRIEDGEWNEITTYTVNADSFYQTKRWNMPKDKKYVTDSMQLRVKVYNSATTYSTATTKKFRVFDDTLSIDKLEVDKSSYILGKDMFVTYKVNSKYDIAYCNIDIKRGSDDYTIYRFNDSEIKEFLLSNSLKVQIPNRSELIGSDVYVEMRVKDVNGLYKTLKSNIFTIIQNSEVPKIFSPYDNIFSEQYNHFPSDATHKETENSIKKLVLDESGIVHMIVEQIASWWGKDNQGHTTYSNRNFRYYYVTYNTKTKYKSSAKLIFENQMIDSGSLPDERYQDFTVNNNTAIMITRNSSTNKMKMYKYSGSTLSSSSAFITDNYGYGSLINYNGKTYVSYRTDSSNVSDRRLKRKELYPTFNGSDMNVIDEYLGGYFRIHGDKIYFYDKGIFFTLNDDLTVVTSSKEEIGVQSKYVRGDIKINDPLVDELLLDDNETLVLLYKDGTREKLFNIADNQYNNYRVISTIDANLIYVAYIDDKSSKKFKVIEYNRNTKGIDSVFIGNKAYKSGNVNNIALFTEDKKIIIGNPDGDYDTAAQVTVGDLSDGLSSTPSIALNVPEEIKIGTPVDINWTLSKESNKLINFEIYRVENGSSILIDTITNKSQRSYSYSHNNPNDSFVVLQVVANFNDGEKSYDQASMQVMGNVTIDSFSTDKSDINLYDKIDFVWSVSGDNANSHYAVYKKCTDETEWEKLFETKEHRQTYKVERFSGECNFKVVSGDSEKILEYPIDINGDVFKFKDSAFSPVGNYTISEGKTKFKWDTYFDGDIEFKLYVKKNGASDFEVIDAIVDREYIYSGDLEDSFDWKVSFDYDGKHIESKVMHVSIGKIDKPSITESHFIMDNNLPTVELKFTSVNNAKSYEIYRSQYNNRFRSIGTTSELQYQDNSVGYGESYSYYIVAIGNDNVKSIPSDIVTVDTIVNDSYEVVMDMDNYQTLSGNEITLKYKPNKAVAYEQYEILIGTDVNDVNFYTLTEERELEVSNLEYGETYYVEVYPVDIGGNRLSSLPAKLTFITGFDNRTISNKPKISIDEVASDHVGLSWNSVVNADEYVVCRSENSGEFECLETIDSVNYVDSINLEEGVKYKYIIKAKNGNDFKVSDESIEVEPIPMETNDLDGDGISDENDPDIDGDGIVNAQDAFPRDASEWLDTDGDGIGNNADDDDDGDGVPDGNDDFPLNPNESVDTDHDGTGNNADKDDDNDGISDTDERRWGFDPLDASDGGNADADGDGVSNADEIEAGSDPLDPDDTKKPKRYVPIISDDTVIMVPMP